MAHYLLLNDPGSSLQHVIRLDSISGAEIRKADQIIKVFLVGGHEITLTHEESKQFLQHLQHHLHQSGPIE